MEVKDICLTIARECQAALEGVDDGQARAFIRAIRAARRIFSYGVGREGLMLKAFAMRLMHLGLNAYVVGDMTTHPLGREDLLVTSSGPGYFSTVAALMQVARQAGGTIVLLTAQPAAPLAREADLVVHLPGQTMAREKTTEKPSIQPMGSLYEQMQLIYFDALMVALVREMRTSYEAMTGRHTNLE